MCANNEKPVQLTLATKDKEMKRVTFKDPIAESKQAKLEVPKINEGTPLHKTKSQPGCPLGLSYWQERKLKLFSAEELKRRNMAWIPKGNSQGKEDVQAPIARRATKMENKNNKAHKQSGRRFSSHRQKLRPAHHPYYSTSPLMPMPWNSSPGMIGYPPWAYFDPWMHPYYLQHERVLPNHYSND
jgi:hypothetical protein